LERLEGLDVRVVRETMDGEGEDEERDVEKAFLLEGMVFKLGCRFCEVYRWDCRYIFSLLCWSCRYSKSRGWYFYLA
jgi:hypothetical protein